MHMYITVSTNTAVKTAIFFPDLDALTIHFGARASCKVSLISTPFNQKCHWRILSTTMEWRCLPTKTISIYEVTSMPRIITRFLLIMRWQLSRGFLSAISITTKGWTAAAISKAMFGLPVSLRIESWLDNHSLGLVFNYEDPLSVVKQRTRHVQQSYSAASSILYKWKS